MKIFKIIILLVLFCMNSKGLVITASNHNSGGKIKALSISVYEFSKDRTISRFTKKINSVDFVKGKLMIHIPSASRYLYLSFDGTAAYDGNILRELYLVKNTDSIHFNFGDQMVSFSGNGAAIMESQFKLHKTAISADAMSIYHPAFLVNLNTRLVKKKAEIDQVIASFAGKLDPQSKSILRTNFYNKYYISYLLRFNNAFLENKRNKSVIDSATTAFNAFKKIIPVKVEDYILENSYNLSLFLIEMNRIAVQLYNKTEKMHARELTSQLFSALKNTYKRKLLDQLLFTYSLDNRFTLSEQLVKEIQVIGSGSSIKPFKEIIKSNKTGNPAFDFKLVAENGKTFSLKDFSGKMVVMHFWFTGCGGCAILTKKMEPVLSRYKGVAEIIFINVNVDKDKTTWQKGLEKGIYTSKQEMNLFTNGWGMQHSLLKAYQFTSFPRMLIIDKHGNLVSSRPPRPSNSGGEAELVSLINRYL